MNKQHPIGSPFDAFSTAEDVVSELNLAGKTAIVTGGYSGIGLETTRALASAGASVVVPARDTMKAEKALVGIPFVEIETVDLANPDSIRTFAGLFLDSGRPLHLLINGAGIMATPLQRDAAGHEGQFATNHLGHFRLTCALWPALKNAEGARVVSVSSRAHQLTGIDFEDIDFKHRQYDKWIAYGQSKTANALFALGLDRRGAEYGIRSFSLHPGQILTDLARHLTGDEIETFGALDEQGQVRIDPANGVKTVEQGAATSVWAATSPLLEGLGGLYCEDCEVAIMSNGDVGRKGVSAWAVDPELAERLWTVSEEMTGQDYLPD